MGVFDNLFGGKNKVNEVKYVPTHLFEEWGKKDPLSNYENYLIEQGVLNQDFIDAYRKEFLEEIETSNVAICSTV